MTATASAMTQSTFTELASGMLRAVKGIGPLGAIILLHVAFFFALQSGLLRQAVHVMPKEIMVSFITPEPKAEPVKPQPAAPKTVPVVKKQISQPKPVAPVVNKTPSPTAITAPPAEPVAVRAEPVASPAAAAPAPAPAAPAAPRTIVSGIEYLQPPQPEYPPISKRMGEEGKAVLRVLVNEKGRPERVEIQKGTGSARLDEAARQAVLRAVFKPFMEDGKAVAAFAIVPIRFQLD